MEISTKLQTETTEQRTGSISRTAQDVEKVLKELVQGARFQGTVLERQGQFELIDVAGTVIRAKSATSLPQGAQVELEVVDDDSPMQVRLLSIMDREAASQATRVNAINREMLGVRAGMSKIASLFSGFIATDHSGQEAQNGTGEVTVKKLITALGQGEKPDPCTSRASFSLFQPASGASSSVLEDIAKVLKAFSSIDAEGSGPQNSGGSPGPSSGQGGVRQAGQTVMDTTSEKSAVKEAQHSGKSAGAKPEIANVPSKNVDALFQNRSVTGKAGSNTGIKPDHSQASSPDIQPRSLDNVKISINAEAEALYGGKKAAAGNRGVVSSNMTAESAKEIGIPGQKGEPGGFVSLASRVARRVNEAGKEQVQAEVGGRNFAASQRPQTGGVSKSAAGTGSVNQTSLEGESTLSRTLCMAAGQKFSENISVGKVTPSPASSRKASQLPLEGTVGRPQPAPDAPRSAEASVPQQLQAHAHDTMQGGLRLTQRAAQTQDAAKLLEQTSAQQAQSLSEQASSRQDNVHRFISALATHTDSVQHYQQQVQNYLNTPFYMIPLWFENGAGHGHWSWWKEEGEHQDGEQGECQHLVFDLELTALGRVNIHLLQDAQGINLYAAASREILPVLREGIGELRESMNAHGFSFAVADIFALDEPGAEELFTPVPRSSFSDSALDIRA